MRLNMKINNPKIYLKPRLNFKEYFLLDLGNIEVNSFYQKLFGKLRKKPDEYITAEDIKYIDRGGYSKAYKIGDYVLKIGDERANEVMPNHPRILQPIIRLRIKISYLLWKLHWDLNRSKKDCQVG